MEVLMKIIDKHRIWVKLLIIASITTIISQIITHNTFNLLEINPVTTTITFVFIIGAILFIYFVLSSRLGVLLTVTLVLILTLIDYGKNAILSSPLNLTDFKMHQELLSINYMDYIDNFKVQFLLIVAGVIFSYILLKKSEKPSKKYRKRGISIIIALGILITSVYMISETNYSYGDSSFIYNFTKGYMSLKNSRVLSPQEEERLLEAIKGSDVKDEINTQVKQPNVVVIMSEAYWDVSKMENVVFEKNPIEFFQTVYEHSIHGRLEVPVFAGGTSNTEFEFLTGVSTHLFTEGLNVYANKSFGPTITIASIFKSYGYDTMALHPFYGWYNKRREIYPNFGFDAFISEKFMNDVKRKGYYISDESDFEYVESLLKKHDNPTFIYNITMQNHGPYDDGRYGGLDLNTDILKPELTDMSDIVLSKYAHGLYDTDRALKSFINNINNFDEDTMIVFFGDHLPLLGENYKAYYETGYLNESDTVMEKHMSLKTTPFFIWTNYNHSTRDLGTIDASFLGATILNELNFKMPKYYSYLLNLSNSIDFFDFNFAAKAGDIIAYDDEAYDETLRNYDLIARDYIFGEQQIEEQPNIYMPQNILNFNADYKTIKVTEVKAKDNEIIIESEPFYENGVIYLDGLAVDTVTKDGKYIIQEKSYDTLQVVLKDTKDNVISSSEIYQY